MNLRTTFNLIIAAWLLTPCVQAGSIGGTIFEDRDRDGVDGPADPPIANIVVTLLGVNGTVSQSTTTAADGSYVFSALPDGNYVVSVPAAGRWRASLPDQRADAAPITPFPFGRARYTPMARSVANLGLFGQFGAPYRHVAIGDSIGFGFNFCGSLLGGEGYIEPVTDRLQAATATNVDTLKQAIPGHETADLLNPGLGPDVPLLYNDIFHAIDQFAPLVSISIGGNDFLGSDSGGDASVAAALVIARRNIQEIISSLQSRLPAADVEINTVYDNLEGADPFHNVWVPIWDQSLREGAWGQVRRVSIAEIYKEYAHDAGGSVLGEPGLICNDIFGLDGIHPTNTGYDVHEEKLWQSFGGVTLSGGSSRLDVSMGFQRMIPIGQATAHSSVTGTTTNPAQGTSLNGIGALVSSNNSEYRVQGFLPNVPPGARAEYGVVKVRYRTTGAPLDDYYVIEASLDGSFAAPGATPQSWNTIIPLVGSSGNDGAVRLAFPDQPAYRIVSAPLYKGAPTTGASTISFADLQSLSVRVVTTAVGTPDNYSVEFDGAFVEIYPLPATATASSAKQPDDLDRTLPSTLDSLTVAASNTNIGVRRWAARALGTHDTPAARATLTGLLSDEDAGVRRIAIRNLAQADFSGDDKLARQKHAQQSEIDQAFVDALQDNALTVRTEAAIALYARGDTQGVTTLIAALDDAQLSKRARRTLASSPVGAAAVIDALNHRSAQIRAVAAWISGQYGPATSTHRESALIRLRHLLNDSEPAVALAAADALARLADTASLDDVLQFYASDTRYSINAARALSEVEDARALARLFQIASSDDSPTARRYATRALALRSWETQLHLQSLQKSDDQQVQRLASSALQK